MWIYKAQQIHKVLKAWYKNKLTLQYIQHNLQINYLIYKCNLIYKKWTISKKGNKEKKVRKKPLS